MFGIGASGLIKTARLRGDLGIASNLGFSCVEFGESSMRLEGDKMVLDGGERRDEAVVDTASCPDWSPEQQLKLFVGYALTSKKKKSFLQPKLEVLARKKGISFVAIDQNRPLSEQGPFDIVLHKLLGKHWQETIEDYQRKHPEVTIIDPPIAIQRLHNRQSMLQGVADMNLSDCGGRISVPKQMVFTKETPCIVGKVTEAGLKFPLVAKPLLVDGTAKSHQLFLAYDEFSLLELEPPSILQEFVNHELPPQPLLERIVKELRSRLGLHLFNIDMIREYGSRDVFYVIDINYFPGYGKMPDYEQTFADFFSSLAQAKRNKKLCK